MKIEDIILTLDNASLLLVEQQDALRKFVRDKNIPLKKRFRVWEQHCDKQHTRHVDIDFYDKMSVAGFIIPLDVSGKLTYLNILAYYRDSKRVKELHELFIRAC